jgi:hypothetical protein
MIKRFTLYGSPHSLPTYKVALMLRLSGEPFRFRYVSFQKGMHQTAEFLALSRWRQVPVLVDGTRAYLQSAAIVPRRLTGSGVPIQRHARWCGNGCIGTSMFCFRPSSIATACNSVNADFSRSTSIRPLPATIASAPRRRSRCWTPNWPTATISALEQIPVDIGHRVYPAWRK